MHSEHKDGGAGAPAMISRFRTDFFQLFFPRLLPRQASDGRQ
jgi:hypothetical protein